MLNMSVKHYQIYCNKAKHGILSEHSYESINKVLVAIQNSFWYVDQCYFRDDSTFNYKQDNIGKASNSFHTGSLHISTTIKIYTAFRQLKVGETQTVEKT